MAGWTRETQMLPEQLIERLYPQRGRLGEAMVQGGVLSRAQLMDRVWEDAPDTGDRTVDTHIKTLRAKLRSVDATYDPIRTHRGMGYSIDVPR